MPQTHTRVVYKPDSMSTDEYIVIIADAEAYKKWKDGDKSVPLVEIVDSFDVFHTGQGSQGLLSRVSKQQLETVFETSKDVDVVTQVLEKGTAKTAQSKDRFGSSNDDRGGGFSVSAGSKAGGGGGR